MAVPIVILDFIQPFRFQKRLMKGAQNLLDFVTSYVREFVLEPDTLDDGVRKFFYDYDGAIRKPKLLKEKLSFIFFPFTYKSFLRSKCKHKLGNENK